MIGTTASRGKCASAAAVAGGLIAGCAGPQSTLDAHGPVAGQIATTWWIMAAGALLVLVLVMSLVAHAMRRDPARPPRLRANVLMTAAGIVLPTVVLGALLVHGTGVGRRITQPAADVLRIEVTGRQWWWQVRYPRDGAQAVHTANELWLPVGVPVEIALTSADVIHSFWIPGLAGKMDMVPGVSNALRLMATKPGRLRLQCAEFCGAQHAHMGMIVTIGSAGEFEAWLQARTAPAAEVTGTAFDRFLALGCGGCHRIDGSTAVGTSGPVLTHFGSRPTVGAGAAPRTAANLRAWLRDHGGTLKPGSTGPSARQLGSEDVQLLATWLEALR